MGRHRNEMGMKFRHPRLNDLNEINHFGAGFSAGTHRCFGRVRYDLLGNQLTGTQSTW